MSLQVLIVGAGPTGLATANALESLGVSCRILDRSSSRSDKSKALGIQAGTLECLDRVLGEHVSEKMVTTGNPTREAWIHIHDQEPLNVKLDSIPSRYNYILILEQSETERILEENLKRAKVERDTEWLSCTQSDEKVISKIQLPSGEIEEVYSDFLIGCDGAHSAVRHALDVPFDGDIYDGEFILGDVKVTWPWAYGTVRNFVSEAGIIASFPFKGEQRYRLILIPKKRTPNPSSLEVTLAEFQSIVNQMTKNQIQVSDPTWLTRFRVSHRMVRRFQNGRVFLAGDAAHIHSPAGGQGMNTGMQDGLNLAHKIKKVLGGKASLDLLRDYEKERIPIARTVLKSTDFVFKLALLPENLLTAFGRRHVFPRIVGSPWVQRRVVRAISEVDVARREMERY